MNKYFIFFLLIFMVTGVTKQGYAFYCGNDIVETGDSSASVYLKCGKPMWQETVETDTYNDETTVFVEKWYYNCGWTDFLYVVTLKAGEVISIKADRRGTGESQCNGKT